MNYLNSKNKKKNLVSSCGLGVIENTISMIISSYTYILILFTYYNTYFITTDITHGLLLLFGICRRGNKIPKKSVLLTNRQNFTTTINKNHYKYHPVQQKIANETP